MVSKRRKKYVRFLIYQSSDGSALRLTSEALIISKARFGTKKDEGFEQPHLTGPILYLVHIKPFIHLHDGFRCGLHITINLPFEKLINQYQLGQLSSISVSSWGLTIFCPLASSNSQLLLYKNPKNEHSEFQKFKNEIHIIGYPGNLLSTCSKCFQFMEDKSR